MTEIGDHPETALPTATRQPAPHAGKIHIRLSDWIVSAKRMMKRRKLWPKLRFRKKVKKVNMGGDLSWFWGISLLLTECPVRRMPMCVTSVRFQRLCLKRDVDCRNSSPLYYWVVKAIVKQITGEASAAE